MILLWFMTNGGVIYFYIIFMPLLKYFNISLVVRILLTGSKYAQSILLLGVSFNRLETLDDGPKDLLLYMSSCNILLRGNTTGGNT